MEYGIFAFFLFERVFCIAISPFFRDRSRLYSPPQDMFLVSHETSPVPFFLVTLVPPLLICEFLVPESLIFPSAPAVFASLQLAFSFFFSHLSVS